LFGMLRLILALFALVFASLWRPSEAPPAGDGDGDGDGDVDGDEGGKDGDGDKEPTAEELLELYKSGKLYDQKKFDHEVGERLARERRKQASEKEAERKRQEAEKLKEQKKYKELSESLTNQLSEKDKTISEREATISELEGLKATNEAYEKELKAILDAQKKDAPDYIKELLETKSLTEQLEYVRKYGEQWSGKPSGSQRVPRQNRGTQGNEEEEKEARERDRQARARSL
jgi:hypothetical protein